MGGQCWEDNWTENNPGWGADTQLIHSKTFSETQDIGQIQVSSCETGHWTILRHTALSTSIIISELLQYIYSNGVPVIK